MTPTRHNVKQSRDCEVDDDCSLENVVLERGAVVRAGAQLKNVIVGAGTRIGREVRIYSPDPERPVRIGSRCWFSHGVFAEGTGGVITIGDHAVLAHRCTLLTSSGPGRDCPILAEIYPLELGDVMIGAHSWLGVNSVVLPGALLEEGVVVGANSLLRGERFEGWSVYGGSPARLLKRLPSEALEKARRAWEAQR